MAEDPGAEEVKIFTDSQLVASQVNKTYQVKSDTLAEYLVLVQDKMQRFTSAEVQHIPREHNARADVLSKLASTKKKGGNKSVIQEVLSQPSIRKPASMIDVNVIGDHKCWMTPVYNYLTKEELPDDPKEASTVRRRACSYVLVEGKLYRRGFSIPLLKCIDEATITHVLREIHEGNNAQHLRGDPLPRRL